jgi:hypothetical protein
MATSQLQQHRIGRGLGHGMVAAALADEMPLAVRSNQIEQGLRHQGIMYQGIALAQETMGLQSE